MLFFCVIPSVTPLAAQKVSGEARLEDLQAAALKDSNDANSHYALALGFWDKKKWDDAETELRESIALAPGYADAHLALAVLPERRGEKYWKNRTKVKGEATVRSELVESESHFRRAFMLNPLVDLKVLGKVDLNEGFTIVRIGDRYVFMVAPWYTATLEKAINELFGGRYEKGFERMDQLAHRKEFGGDDRNLPDQILWYHGLFAAHLEKYDLAIRDFAVLTGRSLAAERDSTRPSLQGPLRTNEYRFILATLLYLGGKHPDAMRTFMRTLEFDVGLYVAHVQMARMREADGDLTGALQERRLALEVNPEDADLQVDLAGTLIRSGRLDEALNPLDEAARLNPRDARVLYLQGMVAWQLDKTELARESLIRFIAIAPSRFADQIDEARQKLANIR
jgi:tetratricopeptide (TPR) repeat protein